jgi:hypothetical protein
MSYCRGRLFRVSFYIDGLVPFHVIIVLLNYVGTSLESNLRKFWALGSSFGSDSIFGGQTGGAEPSTELSVG